MTDLDTSGGFHLDGTSSTVRDLFGNLARSRDLVRALGKQSFYVQYRRASFGLLWSVLLPLLSAGILAFVLTRVSNLSAGLSGLEFTTFILSATCAWNFFSSAVTAASTSIVGGSQLSTKVYFPRAVFPLAAVASTAYGLIPNVVILVAVSLLAGIVPTPALLLLPVAVGLSVILASAFSLVLAACHVYFRDIRYIVAASLQPWFYMTPIFYRLERFASLRSVLVANPVAGIVLLFRSSVLGVQTGTYEAAAWTVGWCVVLVIVAILLYRRLDRVFVDLL